MPKGTEMTFYEREKIEVWLRTKKKKKWIAGKLNRDYSVIKREIKRNSGEHLPYIAADAQHYADRRRKKTNTRKLEKWQNEKLTEYVKERLNDDWSLEEIAGRLKEHPPKEVEQCKNKTVSYESIYNWIYEGEGRWGGLYKKLRRKQKGGVENLNGSIREYFPKKSNLDMISEKQVYEIQEKLNNRPRKALNYLTPNEVITNEISKKGALNS